MKDLGRSEKKQRSTSKKEGSLKDEDLRDEIAQIPNNGASHHVGE